MENIQQLDRKDFWRWVEIKAQMLQELHEQWHTEGYQETEIKILEEIRHYLG